MAFRDHLISSRSGSIFDPVNFMLDARSCDRWWSRRAANDPATADLPQHCSGASMTGAAHAPPMNPPCSGASMTAAAQHRTSNTSHWKNEYEHRTSNIEQERRKEQTEGVVFLSLIFFRSTLDVRSWMFDVRVFFGSALDDRRSFEQDKLRPMGARGRKWMRRDFTWDTVAHRMNVLYESMRACK